MAKLMGKFRAILDRMTIEPIIFFNFLALPLFHLSQHAILYKTVCIQNYASTHPPNACDRLDQDHRLEDLVQKEASAWNMYLSLSYLVPAIGSDIFLGAWSDRKGRKISILLGFAGMIMTSVPYMALAAYSNMPLYILVLANIGAGLTGYIAIVFISSYAYLTDVIPNRSTLTFRMIVVMGFRWIADVIGSFSTSVMLKMYSSLITMLIAQAFFACGFFYALVWIHQIPPEEMRKLVAAKSQEKRTVKKCPVPKLDSNKDPVVSVLTIGRDWKNASFRTEFVSTWLYVVEMYKDVWRTLFKPREDHKRIHMFLCTMVYFFFMVSEVGLQSGPIMSLYVFHRPFLWSPSMLGTFRGVQSVCGLAGSLIGLIINRYMHLEDTTIMLLAISSGFVHLALIGLSRWSWMLYLATIVGSFYSLLVPAVKSFIVRLVEPTEVGKALAANGIAADLAFVASTLIFTNIYRATVSVYAGCVFLIGAFTMACCFGAVLWMHIDKSRLRKRQHQLDASLDRTSSPLASTRPIIGLASYSLTSIPNSPCSLKGDGKEEQFAALKF